MPAPGSRQADVPLHIHKLAHSRSSVGYRGHAIMRRPRSALAVNAPPTATGKNIGEAAAGPHRCSLSSNNWKIFYCYAYDTARSLLFFLYYMGS